MVITAFYYLSYPDAGPSDPADAATEMYVERGQAGDTTEHFEDTFSFQVYTFTYVEREFIGQGRPLVGRSVLVVPTIEDTWMRRFLTDNVGRLPDWGERVGL